MKRDDLKFTSLYCLLTFYREFAFVASPYKDRGKLGSKDGFGSKFSSELATDDLSV